MLYQAPGTTARRATFQLGIALENEKKDPTKPWGLSFIRNGRPSVLLLILYFNLVIDFRIGSGAAGELFCLRFHRFAADGAAQHNLGFDFDVLAGQGRILMQRAADGTRRHLITGA